MDQRPLQDLIVDQWETPCTRYPERQVGAARICRVSYRAGYYRMEGIQGYAHYRLTRRRTPITTLEIDDQVWMIDDPLHWIGMKVYVDQALPGHLLCAGLGLGLMVWHALERADIRRLTVVEIDPDVIELIAPLLPADPRLTIVCDDFYSYRPDEPPDTILWDLAVGDQSITAGQIFSGALKTQILYPRTPTMFFGARDPGGGILQPPSGWPDGLSEQAERFLRTGKL